ncbi:putative late blight resistance protein homolog R1A-4 [Coffea arabica]|uniref:Late blight resistance protein homolog R1A-4 n=1 Tax=Coffea arabica TaxID=13443 RepID=A0ABM4WN77_COFAR
MDIRYKYTTKYSETPEQLSGELALGHLHLPWSKISAIEELPDLEVLTLLDGSFVGERWELTPGGFRELRCLSLENLDVVEWEDVTDGGDALPCLQKLRLIGVWELETVPSCLQRNAPLMEIEVMDCNYILNELVHEIGEEHKDWGNAGLKITID